MKNIVLTVSVLYLAVLACLPVQAGLINGARKGLGKATKSVAGCADRGVKGIHKGAKTCTGGVGKAVKTVF